MNTFIPLIEARSRHSFRFLYLSILLSAFFPLALSGQLSVSFTDVTEPGCFGLPGGSVRAVADGGTAPYQYTWNNGTEGDLLEKVLAGTYSVTVVDADDNTASASIALEQPDLVTVDFDAQDCELPLKVTAVPSGGISPYVYRWSTGENSATIMAASGTEYCVTVTDDNNCGTFSCITLEYQPLEISLEVDNISCPGVDDGTVRAVHTGGGEPFSYLWNTGDTTQNISDLPPGTYSVTVTDSKGCTASAETTLEPRTEIVIDLEVTEPFCVGDSTGSIQATISGGVPPLEFMWSTGDTTLSLSGLAVGTYEITVTGADGCPAIRSIDLDYQSQIKIEVDSSPESCPGQGDGSLTVMVNDGIPPYSYAWSNGDTTEIISSVDPGTYQVTVTDSVGCQDTASVVLEPASGIVAEVESTDVNLCEGMDGTASVIAVDGEGPFTFLWSTGDTTMTIDSLAAGTYSVTISNATECEVVEMVTVGAPPALDIEVSGTPLLCPGDSLASLSAEVTGGTEPFNYLWSTGEETAEIDSLTPGMYSITVTDAAGCSASEEVEVKDVPPLDIMIGGISVVCGAGNTGSASANVSGGSAPYTYEWSTGATSKLILGLESGVYYVTATDAIGCSIQDSVEVKIIDDLAVEITGKNIGCAGQMDGSAIAVASGGDAPYSYFWSNGATGDTISNLSAGTYVVTVADANNCTSRDTIEILRPAPIIGLLDITDLNCQVDTSGAVDLTVSGGTPPYAFAWSNGATTEDISGLEAGTYRVTITDENNCFVIRSGTVDPPAPIDLNLSSGEVSCKGGDDGSVNVSVNGGTAPYTYSWSNGSSDPVLTGVTAGTYGLTVTDAEGCSGEGMVTVTELPALICSINQLTEVVLGGDGSLEVVVEGGTPPYSYRWSNGSTTSGIDSLDGGAYSVTITDANQCTTTCEFEIVPLSGLGDFVWIDADRDGIQDAGELPIADITVWLRDETGLEIDSTTTDSSGIYIFVGLEPGTYSVRFGQREKYSFTILNAGSNEAADSDANAGMNGGTAAVTLAPGEFNWTLDAGYTKDCINITDPGAIAGDQYLCGPGNDPGPLESLAPATGGEGEIEYLWMYSTEAGPFNGATWTAIPNSDTPNYDPGIIYVTTYFARCARREECPGFLETNIVKVEVGAEAISQIAGPLQVCQGELAAYEAVGMGEDAHLVWNFGPGAQPATAIGPSAQAKFTSFGTFTIELSVTENNCTATTQEEILVISNPVLCGEGLVINTEVTNVTTREVNIDWQVPMDDLMNFTIEYSEDGRNFSTVARRSDPTRYTAEAMEYSVSVIAPKRGRSFYRVKMSDGLGNEWLSNTEEVVFFNESDLAMLYPNPVSSQAVLELFETFNEEMTIELMTFVGQKLTSWKASGTDQRINLDLGDIPNGGYILRIWYGGNRVKTLRFVKN